MEVDDKKRLKEKGRKALKENFGIEQDLHLDIMLNYEKKPFKSMAIGEHNGNYYFGTILYYGSRKVPAIICDDGRIYYRWEEKIKNEKGKDETKIEDGIRDKFKLRYRFELFDDVVDNLWSNSSIKSFREGTAKKQTFQELFKIIKDKNQELIYHSDKRVHSFVACDLISNYFYPLFNAKGRTYFQADFGSGKSRQSLIYQKLSFNSLFASQISPASFERVIESTGGTIIVDNFDNILDELKIQILQAIEVYYKKGGKNIKADGIDHKPIAYNGYSPLVINNIVGLPEVTESRCNKIQMLKTDKKNIVDIKINEHDPFWNETKDRLHLLALQNWKQVKETYQDLEVPELSARDLERTEAVLTIAKCIGEEVYEEVLSFFVESNEQQSIKEVSDSWEFIIFEFLNKMDEQEIVIKVKDITNSVGFKVVQSEKSEKSDKLKFSHYIGKLFRGIPLFKKKVIDGWVHYDISRENLNKILKIKGYDKYLTIPHPTSLNNTNNTNNTLIGDTKEKESDVVMFSEVSMVKRVSGGEKKDTTFTEEPDLPDFSDLTKDLEDTKNE